MEQLDFLKAKKLLNKYKIDLSGSLVKNEKQLANLSKNMDFPVIIKIMAKDIIHKSDLGLINADIQNQEELISNFEDLMKKAKKKTKKIDGI